MEAKIMSYDEFKKIVKKEFTKDEIEGFGKTHNGYGVYVIAYGEKEIEFMCDDLRQYGFECKWWHSSDPEDDEPIYFIEAIPIMNESKKSARKSLKEGLIDIRKQIQNYADVNEFDITLQTTPKNELIIAFGGTSDTDKIYNALIKELKSKGANLSKVDVKKKNDIVVVTWDLNFSNEGMFDEIIIDGIIDLIDNLSEVVDLHYVF